MNNYDHSLLNKLMQVHGVRVELISTIEYGDTFEVDAFYYAIFLDEVQKIMTGLDDLDDFEGIHQLEEATYVGIGWSLKEAWDDFNKKIDTMNIASEVQKIKEDYIKGE